MVESCPLSCEYMNPSQKCGSGFRARRGSAQKRSIHASMWAFWADPQRRPGHLDAFLRWVHMRKEKLRKTLKF